MSADKSETFYLHFYKTYKHETWYGDGLSWEA